MRNLERAGVPRSVAMQMVGHKTEAMYRRYSIVDEVQLREAADKLARLTSSTSLVEVGRSDTPPSLHAARKPS